MYFLLLVLLFYTKIITSALKNMTVWDCCKNQSMLLTFQKKNVYNNFTIKLIVERIDNAEMQYVTEKQICITKMLLLLQLKCKEMLAMLS